MTEQLITDHHHDLFEQATAVFNLDRTHRYLLTRSWADTPPLVFVMLNPSTADAFTLDNTVRRCLGFARREQAGGIVVVNLFGLRSTDPSVLREHPDPVGASNDWAIRRQVERGYPVVAAWGTHGRLHDRGRFIAGKLRALTDLVCLGVTRDGWPLHPLYVRGDAPLVPWNHQEAA